MPSLSEWSPYRTHVQGGLPAGNFVHGQFVLLCAGPPFYSNLALPVGTEDTNIDDIMVYPIGLAQNFALSQNKQFSRIFEIGSDRSYFMSGRSAGQVSMGRVMYHGVNLLRALYAYYDTDSGDQGDQSYRIRGLMETAGFASLNPFKTGGAKNRSTTLHTVHVPPGYDNFFINLASDLFSQPMGLLVVMQDNEGNYINAFYLEQCVIPQHSMAVDAQGVIIQESVGIQYEMMIPIRLPQLDLISGVLADETGGFSADYLV